jgi:hypothetical protein
MIFAVSISYEGRTNFLLRHEQIYILLEYCLEYCEVKGINIHSFEMSKTIWKVLFSSNLYCKPTWADYLEYYEVWFYQVGQIWNDYFLRFLWEMKNDDFALVTCLSEMSCQTLR